ncbi:hypothetical protein NEMBOFW57_001614 [Staphylotrichum longicolle]|uniref:tRNA(Phe) 7-[(3-amino-3-carboxypropyl)-4-demethylwyosine(37)-N(4)]-methyltransferase n=1 Tax=Staphylotrichum longicolle TaxID=669026 RepID=A0AAD4F263_9PEZI|nr:hypothetical protein NEMBOFW57_001614 [Staphylotrichum longicolle]
MKNLPAPGNSFALRKQKILSQLSVPDEEYTDASPKGSVDAGIRHLIDQLNGHAGLVTTSSCAGRVSVYLEGRKTPGPASMGEAWSGESERASGNAASSAGGKGGGEWLFVSHDPVEERHRDGAGAGGEKGYEALLLGLQPAASARDEAAQHVELIDRSSRLIHFKFEPMEHAQLVIQAGMEAGFRESGAVSLLKRHPDEEATPMVAVRSMGLSFESLIGAETDGVRRTIVSPQYLKTLVQIANERFVENERRIARFSAALEAALSPPKGKGDWEDAQARRERKRQEGLKRREELKKDKSKPVDESGIDLALDHPDID